jgi:MoaA/NifB/PqqE/SkfB family radical SAM enzyme
MYKKYLNSYVDKLGLDSIDQSNIFPKYIEIEAYDGCNLNCIMCPLGKDIYKGGGAIDMSLFRKIVSQLENYKDWINNVCLSRNGEPLLNKHVPEMIKLLKDIGIKRVNFSTNGTALTDKTSRKLIESGLDEIRFSVDGYHKNTYENIRKGGNYDKLLENIIHFINLRNDYKADNLQVQLRLVEQELNKNEIIEWEYFWRKKLRLSDVVASKKLHSWGNEHINEGYSSTDVKHPCISPFSTLEILYDGTVPLCGCDYIPKVNLGNVNNTDIIDIWRSNKFLEIRNDHAIGNRNNIEICIGCQIWDDEVKTVHSEKI